MREVAPATGAKSVTNTSVTAHATGVRNTKQKWWIVVDRRVSPAERRREREAQHLAEEKKRKARRAYYMKFVAHRPAQCHQCKETKTANDMIDYARREVSVKNKCLTCFDKELDEERGYETEFPGDRIYWKMNP